jgi:glycosyltransferase involved in cell wall biosynthesis
MPAADVVVYAANAGALYGAKGVPGGAELQSVYMARALATHGYSVRHVVADAEISRTSEGVEIVRLAPHYAERGLPRRLAIVQALRRSDGGVYIQRTAGIETGFVGVHARLFGRRFVFSASSDADFLRDRELLRQLGGSLESWSTRTQARLGIRCAHTVVAQTEQQVELAKDSFGLRAKVIRSFCDPGDPRPEAREAFLWIGAFVGVKDPHSFLTLAERVPEAPFWMVADERLGWDELAASVRERAARLPNLELLPPRPRDDLLGLYRRALAVVSTSRYEGFSNTFLEGWARGVPAISFRVDPDGVIVRHGLGLVAGGSMDALEQISRRYLEDRAVAERAGDAGHRYVCETHSPSVVGPIWGALVKKLLANRERTPTG